MALPPLLAGGARLAVAVRALTVVALLGVDAGVVRSEPGLGGDKALLLLATVALMTVAWLVFLLARAQAPQVVALALVAGCAALADHLRPASPAFLVAFLAMGGASVRLPVRWAVPLLLGTAAAISLSDGLGATHTIPVEVTYTFVAATLFGAAAFARTFRDAQRRAERIVIELQATRRAEAEAAVLAERARLAREMHDILAHVLSALSLRLEGTRLLLEREHASPLALEQLERARRLAHDGFDEAQRAIAALRGELPGPQLLPRLVEQFTDLTGVRASLRVEGEARELGREAAHAVYRTAQEALTNAAKHAHPDQVDVVLSYLPGAVRLVVEDRATQDAARPFPPLLATAGAGAGVRAAPAARRATATRAGPRSEPETTARTAGTVAPGGSRSGYGLIGLRERAELLGGELTAAPTADGFRVCLQVPA
jgi:signal transduction histidine kinase